MKIIKKFVLSQMGNNCFLIDTNGKIVLIDAPDNISRVIEFLKENELKLDYVICTHTHIDHIKGLEELYDKNIIDSVYTSKGEMELVNDNSAEGNLGSLFEENVNFKGIIKDVQDISDELEMEIKYISGHSKESAVYIFLKDKVMFVGDVLFNNSIGRSDLAYGDIKKLLKGIKNELLIQDEEMVVHPGHGFKTFIGLEKTREHFMKEVNNG